MKKTKYIELDDFADADSNLSHVVFYVNELIDEVNVLKEKLSESDANMVDDNGNLIKIKLD